MSNHTVRLGFMPPLTGLVKMYGTEIVRAGQIACDEINERGGVLGRPLELVIEDDGSLPESAVAAATRLVDHHHCAALIGNLLSNSRIAVAYRVAEPRRIPYLNFSFYEGSILSRYFFHFAALPNQQIERMIPFMREHYGPKMFFAGNNYEWPRGSIDAAKRALEQVGGQVLGEEYCPIGASNEDIERLLDHVAESGADVFVPYFAGADQIRLLTRFTERGLKKRMAVVMGHYDEVMASRLPPEVREGFYSSNTYFMTLDTPENRAYLARLAKQPGVNGIWPQGDGILTNFGEGAYLCVKAFAEAANRAGSLDAEALIEALESIEVSGPQGTVQMDAATHHAQVNTYLSRCEADGSFTIVERFGAIPPSLPERYQHLRIGKQSVIEDIYLQSRMMVQITEAVLLVHATNRTIVYANMHAERIFGYGPNGLTGKCFSALFAPSGQAPEELAAAIGATLSQKGAWQGETENVSGDGRHFWCATSISAFTHPEHGEVWMLVNRDISERKQIEEQLRASEAMLRRTQTLAAIGSWQLDTASGTLLWSDETYRIFDIPAGTPVTYDTFLAQIHPGDRAFVNSAWQAAFKGAPYRIQYRILARGETRWMEEHAELDFDAAGNLRSGMGSVQDITERKHAEMTLAHNIRDLNERVKEIACLRDITRLSLDKELDLEHMLDACVRRMPAAWLAPERTYARIRLNGHTFATCDFRESAWRMAADIPVAGMAPGLIEVFYSGEAPAEGVSPFLDEEYTLIQSIATQLSQALEKRQAEEALLANEAKFRRLIKVAPIPLCYVAQGGIIQNFNDRFAQVFGYTHEDIPTLKEWWQLAYPDPSYREWVLATWNAAVQKATESGQDIRPVEYQVTCKNGAVRTMEISGVTLGDDFLATFIDLTERKLAEIALSEALEKAKRFSDALDNVSAYIYLKNRQRQYIHANKPTLKLFGCTAEELVGCDDTRFFPPATVAHLHEVDSQVLERGESTHEEIPVKDQGGERIYWETKTPIYNSKGEITGLCGISYDITERKQVEQALRDSEAALREAQRIGRMGSWHLDIATNHVVWTEELYRMYGFDPALPPPPYTEHMKLFAPESWEKLSAALAHTLETGAPYELELETVHTDGSRGWVWVIGERLADADGRPIGLRGVAQDITGRKQAEEEIRQLNADLEQRVAERTAELEGFAYSVSHDLRVPLRAIDGFSRIVLKQYENKLDDEGKRLLNIVRDNTSRMGQLIDDILAFSRAGRLEMRLTEVDMEAAARDAWQELEPLRAGREVPLDIGPLPKAHGDPAMLRQVWINLLGNAIKFTAQQSAARIAVESANEGAELVYRVRDNGAGFDMQYAGKLFGVFQRLHGVDEFEGTGIGLAIVKRIITRHGGRVWAEGKVGEGAVFHFALPDGAQMASGPRT